eukprot:7731778-Pyramimonas_sp.AAC.1
MERGTRRNDETMHAWKGRAGPGGARGSAAPADPPAGRRAARSWGLLRGSAARRHWGASDASV